MEGGVIVGGREWREEGVEGVIVGGRGGRREWMEEGALVGKKG
jgi:hypothetical protein